MCNSYRRLFVPPLAGLEGQGRRSLGGGSSPAGVSSSPCQGSSTVSGTHPHAFLRPHVHQGGGSGGGHSCPHFQGSGRTCSSAFSRLLQPSVCGVEDLGVLVSRHRPLSPQPLSRFLSFQDGDRPVCSSLGSYWGLDGVHRFEEAYLQIPVHPDSRKYLRFVAFGRVYQFRALCFGLASAPQVFTRVMAPVSSILHSMGFRLRCYLDDWLIQSSSWEAVLHDLQVVLNLCREFGIVVNP